MTKQLMTLALLGSLIISTSCKDEDDKVNKTDLLTSKTWRLIKTEAMDNGQYMDLTEEEYEECEADDFLKFYKDGKFEQNPGELHCYVGDETTQGIWRWADGEKKLIVTTDYVVEMNLDELTNGKLKVSGTSDSLKDGVIMTYTYTPI